MFWRVVWKEYRQQRALWLAIAAAGVVMQIGVILYHMLNSVAGLTDALFTVALSVPVLYSLGCGAALFAGEQESGTFSFQQSLPVSAGRVFVGKLAFAAVSALALFPVLWFVAWVFSNWRLPELSWHMQLWGGGSIAAIEVLIWAALGSLALRRVLPAAVVSGLIAVLLGYGSFVLVIAFGDLFREQVNEYFSTLPLRSLCALFALAIAVKLGRCWFDEHPTLLDALRPRAESPDRSTRTPRATSRTMMWHLVWHEWRQSRGKISLLVAAYFTLVVWFGFIMSGSPGPQWEITFILLPALATALGACMFWSDQQGQHYYYFTEHGVRPRLVWLSRQAVSGLVLTAVVVVACLPLLLGWPQDEGLVGATLGLAVVMFAAGQACSIFIRSGVVAIFSAIICSIVLFVWSVFLQSMGVWWVVSSLALPFIFWWATWLYVPKWIQQRTSWRVRLVTAASVVVPVLCVAVGAAAYRVYEIPAIQTSFDAAALTLREPVSSEANKTAQMYRQATALLREKVSVDESEVTTITKRDDDWRRGIELFIAASQRTNCRFGNWSDLAGEGFFDGTALTRAVVAEAKQQTADGDLDGAAELYKSLLALASHHYQQPSSTIYVFYARAVEDAVWQELPAWAIHSEQERESVLDMLAHVHEFTDRNNPNWEAGTLEQCELIRRFIALDDEVLSGYYAIDERELTLVKVLNRLMPWERARVARLLDVYAEAQLQEIAREATLPPSQLWPSGFRSAGELMLTRRLGRSVLITEADMTRWLRTTPWFQLTTPFGGSFRSGNDRAKMHRRAVQTQLALIAWRMEHGMLPELLEQLVGHGLSESPIDPFTGQPFVYLSDGVQQLLFDDPESGGMSMSASGIAADGTLLEPKVVPTDPLIWSPAEDLYYVPGIKRGPSASPDISDFRTISKRPAQGATAPPPGEPLTSDVQLLHYGEQFFIPSR